MGRGHLQGLWALILTQVQANEFWLCLPVTSLFMEKDTKSIAYGCKSCSLHKGAQLGDSEG